MSIAQPTCPLCGAAAGLLLDDAIGRFWLCPECALAFRDISQQLTQEQELARYLEHRNSLDDPRYLDFLGRLARPLASRLPPGAPGLDFGCGPVPGMELVLAGLGFRCASYDPFFRPDRAALERQHDFLTCSEVLEHIADPRDVLDQLARLVRPGGIIGIMTQFRDDTREFGEWYYRRDPTHVCFYSPETLRWIARWKGWNIEIPAPGVALFATGA